MKLGKCFRDFFAADADALKKAVTLLNEHGIQDNSKKLIPKNRYQSDPSLEVLQAQMRSLQIQNSFYFDPHWSAEKWKKNSTTMPHSEWQQLNVNFGDKRSRILAIPAIWRVILVINQPKKAVKPNIWIALSRSRPLWG